MESRKTLDAAIMNTISQAIAIRTEASAEIRADVAAARQIIEAAYRRRNDNISAAMSAFISQHKGGPLQACDVLIELVGDLRQEAIDRAKEKNPQLCSERDDDATNDPRRGLAAELNAINQRGNNEIVRD